MCNKPATSEQQLARIAARQHGVVTVAQLRTAGIDRFAAARRARAGRLHRVHRGVYAVGHTGLSFEGRCLAAVLACGTGAVASHVSAAALWGMLPPSSRRIDVTVPGDGGRDPRRGISLHRSRTLTGELTTLRSGVPVTPPARTLTDLGRAATHEVFQRALRRAIDLRLVSEKELGPGLDLTRSELERMFLRLCRRRRLPVPEVNVRVAGCEVDFLWRDRRLIVETDGFRHHGSRAAFESDRARDARLLALGYRVLRFTHRQVQQTPAEVAASVRRLIGSGS